MEDSEYIVYSGSTPNQVVTPALRFFVEQGCFKRLFVIGTDGLSSNISAHLIRDELKVYPQISVVGEQFALLGETGFKKRSRRSKSKPDLIFNFAIGVRIRPFSASCARGWNYRQTDSDCLVCRR